MYPCESHGMTTDDSDVFKNGSKVAERSRRRRLHQSGHAFARELNGHDRSTG